MTDMPNDKPWWYPQKDGDGAFIKPTLWDHTGDAIEDYVALAEAFLAQQAIIDKLPKTADGVPVVPLPGPVPDLWHIIAGRIEKLSQEEWDFASKNGLDMWGGAYSTAQAARDAAERQK